MWQGGKNFHFSQKYAIGGIKMLFDTIRYIFYFPSYIVSLNIKNNEWNKLILKGLYAVWLSERRDIQIKEGFHSIL